MGIELQDGVSVPGGQYKRVHAVRIDIHQDSQEFDTNPSIYQLRCVFKMFTVDGDGRRHYSGNERLPDMANVLQEAQSRAVAGKPKLLTAFAAVQDALGELIAEYKETQANIF